MNIVIVAIRLRKYLGDPRSLEHPRSNTIEVVIRH
jgi:hypothetical protein